MPAHRPRLAAWVALGSAVALTAAGCGGSADDDGSVTLLFTWWGDDSRARATQEVVDLFEERNPGITVNTSFTSGGNYFEKLSTEVAGGNPPDVFQLDYSNLREFADRGVVLNLADHGDAVDLDGVADAMRDAGRIDDGVYGLPMGQNTHALIYDPQLWEEAGVPTPEYGWTWDDFFDSARAITDSTDGEVYGSTDFGWSWETFQAWLRQRDRDLYTEDGSLAFDESDVREYLTLLDDFREGRATTPASLNGMIDGAVENTPFAKGLSATDLAWDSVLAGYHTAMGRPLAMAPLPSDTDRFGQYAKPSMLISAAQASDHPREAAMLIDFVINDVDAGRILGTTRGLPPNQEVREALADDLEGLDRQVYDYETSLEEHLEGTPPAPPEGNGTLKREWQRHNDAVSFGNKTIEEAAADFMRIAEQEVSG
ncbi:ABC transporter substrate-binding protein [Actinoalloteichus spitiensis]|uniref:ABC transporter substrate-binding protein n=1 Tax=Actinoalloteichus spitiensis TaxID=252394 RepID=UPI0003693755|nr:ABC transporter substrate-binding protein [Actinoalloteichus spitiensis]